MPSSNGGRSRGLRPVPADGDDDGISICCRGELGRKSETAVNNVNLPEWLTHELLLASFSTSNMAKDFSKTGDLNTKTGPY